MEGESGLESSFWFKDRMRVLEWARGPLLDPALMLDPDCSPRGPAQASGCSGRMEGSRDTSSK